MVEDEKLWKDINMLEARCEKRKRRRMISSRRKCIFMSSARPVRGRITGTVGNLFMLDVNK